MAGERPFWRQIFDVAERAIGEPLETSLASPEFIALVSRITRLRRTTAEALEGAVTAHLHLFGLPSVTDVRDISSSLTRLERRMRDVQELLEDLQEASERPPP